MSWLRVNRCICGCDLKTGSIILLWTYVVFGVLYLAEKLMSAMSDDRQLRTGQWQVGTFVEIACSIAGLYAIEKKKPSLLLPYIWFNVLSLTACITIIFTISMFGSYMVKSKIFTDTVNDMLPIIEIVLLVYTVVGIYLTTVVYSYYKTMLEGLRRPIRHDVALIEGKPSYPSLPDQDVITPS